MRGFVAPRPWRLSADASGSKRRAWGATERGGLPRGRARSAPAPRGAGAPRFRRRGRSSRSEGRVRADPSCVAFSRVCGRVNCPALRLIENFLWVLVRGSRGPRAVLNLHLCVRRSGVLGCRNENFGRRHETGPREKCFVSRACQFFPCCLWKWNSNGSLETTRACEWGPSSGVEVSSVCTPVRCPRVSK